MSSQRNSSTPRYGNGTVAGNLNRPGASAPQTGPGFKTYGSGMVSLGVAKKPRTTSAFPDRKLTVPKPVNLPSLRKENAGNDPNTQLVPSGGQGGWQKPETEEKPEDEPVPNLTAGSSWASAPSASGVPSWQPPQPFPVATAAPSGTQKARNLNPLEYPSLSAAAVAQKPIGVPLQPVPHLPTHVSTGGGNWDEDERKPVFGTSRLATESWADSRVDDEPRALYRPPWEQNGHSTSRPSEDHWSRSKTRFTEVVDPHLFPPPPPPKQPPPPPPRGGELSKEEAEAEKRAFEAEIDRVIEEERKREKEAAITAAQETARIQALEEEEAAAAAAAAELAAAKAKVASLSESENLPPTAEQREAALETARQNAIAARKRREAEEEENDRKRKEAARAKLKELEDRISARKRELEDAEISQNAEDIPAEQVLDDLAAAVAQTVESSAQSAAIIGEAAVHKEIQITRLIEHEHEADSNREGSVREDSSRGDQSISMQADAGSSVALSESLEGFKDISGITSDTESAQGSKSAMEGWGPKPTSVSQPRAIWQHRPKTAEASAAPLGTPPGLPSSLKENKAIEDVAQAKEQSGPAALFGASSNFGPALVTSLGISKEEAASEPHKPPSQDTGPTSSAPSGPLNWRAVLGGTEPEEPKQGKLEELSSKSEGPAGRGRGRGKKDRGTREDSSELGGRGRGNRDRGRGKGRGRGRQTDSRDDAAVTLSTEREASDTLSQSTDQQAEGNRRQNRGRGRGDLEGRGRGKGRGNNINATQQQPPPPPPAKEETVTEDDLPPGMFPNAQKPQRATQEPTSQQPGVASQQADDLPWPAASTNGQNVLDSFNDLSLSSSALDPIIATSDNRDRTFDRPIDRPKSAAGAVGQQLSKNDANLPNGIPSLPSDLTMEALGGSKPQSSSNLPFGFQANQSLAPGPFPGVFFQGQNDPWQSRPAEPSLEAVQSFYKGGPDTSPSPRDQPGPQASSGLQFGAFGAQSFPQFGQLSNSFGQAPFIHTGKQPDWSTGPSLGNNVQSTAPKQPEGPNQRQHSGPEFNRLDAIVQPSSLNKRGPLSAPGHPPGAPGQHNSLGPPGSHGPPGLQRGSHQQSGPPQSLLPGDLYSHDHPSRSPPPPPGLQNSSTTSSQGPGPGPGPAQSFYYNNSNFNSSNQSRTPRAMSQSQYGSPQVNVSFSMPQQQRMGHLPFASDFQQQPQQQQHFNQGVPQGAIKGPGRDQMPQLPEDVFDSNTPKGDPSLPIGHFQTINGVIQGRGRAIDNRGRGGRGPTRAPGPGRGGRVYGGRLPNVQGGPGGRGPSPQQHMAMLPNQGFPPVNIVGPLGGPGFTLQQGPPSMGLGPQMNDQMQGAKRAPVKQNRGGRGGPRNSQDGGPSMAGSYVERRQ